MEKLTFPDFDETSECGLIAVIGIGQIGARITQRLSQNLLGSNYWNITFCSIHEQMDSLPKALTVIEKSELGFVVADFKDIHDGTLVQILSEKARKSGMFSVGVVPCLEEDRTGKVPRLVMQSPPLLDVNFQVSAASMPRTEKLSDSKQSKRDLDEQAMQHTVATISNLITRRSIIGIDIADVKEVLRTGSQGWLGAGVATGPQAGKTAALLAVERLQDQGVLLTTVKGVCVEVSGSPSMTMEDFDDVSRVIDGLVPESVSVLIGLSQDESLGQNIQVTAMMMT